MEPNHFSGLGGARADVAERRTADARVWTVTEAAALLGISRAHAYELVARQELPHLRLGRRIVIPKRTLDNFLDISER